MLENKLGARYTVVNASISGDTTAGGLTRLPAALERHRPDLVILELGGNDGLRGGSLKTMHANLLEMVRLAERSGAKVLLLGMRIPPNLGPQYTDRFHAIYADVARDTGVALVPFLLEGIATRPEMMQDDGVHPSEAGQPRMLENVWPHLHPLLGS